MSHTIRQGLVATFLMFAPTLSLAEEFLLSTANHPHPSYLNVEIYLGNDSDPFESLIFSTGEIPLQGWAQSNINLDANHSGNFSLTSSQFVADDAGGTIDLAEFGTIDFAILGFGFEFTTQSKTVTEHEFGFPFTNSSALVLNQGVVSLFNLTGLIWELVGIDPLYARDFADDPQYSIPEFNLVEPFTGLVDSGSTLAHPGAELQLDINSFATPLWNFDDTSRFWMRLTGQMNLAVPVPEPSTLLLGCVFTLLLFGRLAAKRGRQRG